MIIQVGERSITISRHAVNRYRDRELAGDRKIGYQKAKAMLEDRITSAGRVRVDRGRPPWLRWGDKRKAAKTVAYMVVDNVLAFPLEEDPRGELIATTCMRKDDEPAV